MEGRGGGKDSQQYVSPLQLALGGKGTDRGWEGDEPYALSAWHALQCTTQPSFVREPQPVSIPFSRAMR